MGTIPFERSFSNAEAQRWGERIAEEEVHLGFHGFHG
jgi:hypothetical protein